MAELQPLAEAINLGGKSAVVTGGAKGIGFGIAYRLAEAGAKVLIADLDEKGAGEAAKKLQDAGFVASSMRADVSKAAEAEALVVEAAAVFGSLDILVNNAGIYPLIKLADLREEDIDRILSINLKGAMLCTKAAATQMQKQGTGGRIINITSIDALKPYTRGLSVYDASKHGLYGFTQSMALELAPLGITVNAIAPGGINTPGTGAGHRSAEAEKEMQEFAQRIPMKRLGEPDDIGKVALFLASDLAGYMTGAQIVVDGGALLA